MRELTDKELDAVAAAGTLTVTLPGDRVGFIIKIGAEKNLSVQPEHRAHPGPVTPPR
jgi:hypothetical protein